MSEERTNCLEPSGSVGRYLEEFQIANSKIEPLDLCLTVGKKGEHKILPILPSGKFLDGEYEVEAIWFCKVETATRLIGQIFSQNKLLVHFALLFLFHWSQTYFG